MESGQDGLDGQSVLSPVARGFRNDQECAYPPRTMANGVKEKILKQDVVAIKSAQVG